MAKAKGGKKGENFDSLKERIKAQMEEAEERHRVELLRHRIDIAKSGISDYEKGHYQEAIKSYLTYLKIMEDWKKVGRGRLTPKVFNPKEDGLELLLISGIYWDLAKLFDQSNQPAAQRSFKQYMMKYIEFSRGTQFQPLAAESLRKYVLVGKARHKSDFNYAYNQLKKQGCFVATALIDEIQPGTLPLLRDFRDGVLQRTSLGRLLIRLYYLIGPRLAYRVEKSPKVVKKTLARTLDILAKQCSRS